MKLFSNVLRTALIEGDAFYGSKVVPQLALNLVKEEDGYSIEMLPIINSKDRNCIIVGIKLFSKSVDYCHKFNKFGVMKSKFRILSNYNMKRHVILYGDIVCGFIDYEHNNGVCIISFDNGVFNPLGDGYTTVILDDIDKDYRSHTTMEATINYNNIICTNNVTIYSNDDSYELIIHELNKYDTLKDHVRKYYDELQERYGDRF